jgi:glycosyltransferase involved in cell wall biosynthesis
VGAEERLFRPAWRPPDEFSALFVGKLIPLHGLPTILAAARLLADVPFRVVGSGQEEWLLGERPSNVEWRQWVNYARLPDEYAGAGCALGIFDAGAKAARVIPNKVFQALACGTPVITADTQAARELLTDGKDAMLVPPADPGALASAIDRLQSDPAFAAGLGSAGLETFRRHASEETLGARWRGLIEQVLASN